MSKIIVSARSNTDIWRKPPTTNRFNAPTSGHSTRGPLEKFQSAQVTFSFTPTTQYDQAGLLLHLTKRGHPCQGSGTIATDSELHQSCKWLKTGIEFYEGEALVGPRDADRDHLE